MSAGVHGGFTREQQSRWSMKRYITASALSESFTSVQVDVKEHTVSLSVFAPGPSWSGLMLAKTPDECAGFYSSEYLSNGVPLRIQFGHSVRLKVYICWQQ